MRSFEILCHYDGIFRSKEEDHLYIGGGRRVILIDGDVTFNIFESQIRNISGSVSSLIKIMYSLNCGVT